MKLNALWVAAGLVFFTAQGCKQPPPPEQKVPVPAKVKSFAVDKTEVAAGETVTLSWEVEDASDVTLATQDGQVVELADAKAATGSAEAKVDRNTVYLLTAHGEGGSASAAVSVVVTPDVKSSMVFTAVPEKIRAGESSTLVWNVPGAAHVNITDSAGEAVYSGEEAAGSIAITPAATETYAIDADGLTAQVQVEVSGAIVAFNSSAPAVAPGEAVTLSWSVRGAESVSLSASGRGVLTTITSAAEMADGSFEDTVPAELHANTLVTYTLTAKVGGDEQTRTLTVYVGSEPAITFFSMPRFSKVGTFVTLGWRTVLASDLEIRIDGKTVHVATTPTEVASGTFSIATPAGDATVELRVSNGRGGQAVRTQMVSAVEATAFVSFAANPPVAMNGGDPVTLSWEVTNARHIRISVKDGPAIYDATGPQLDFGSFDVYPNGPTEYVLDADNTVGDVISPQSATADVTTPAKLLFSPSPAPLGSQVELTGTTVVNGGSLRAPELVAKNQPGDAFVDISTTGTALPVVSKADTTAYQIQLASPFQTSIAGYPVNTDWLSVSINGWMVFSPNAVVGPSTPPAMPNSAYEPLAIVPFGANLLADESSRIFWKDEGQGPNRRLIVQWEDIPYWINPNYRASFQAQLSPNGEVVFAYKRVINFPSYFTPAIGIIGGKNTEAFTPAADQLTSGKPVTGDTFHFFGELTLPFAMTATTTPLHVVQQVGSGTIDIFDTPATSVP